MDDLSELGVLNESVSNVRIDVDGSVAILSFIHSGVNILTQETRMEIRRVIEWLELRSRIRALVITDPDNFCLGANIHDFNLRKDNEVARLHCRNGHEMTLALLGSRLTIIAAVEGYCLGGGLELALACDFRVVSISAHLGFPEIDRGAFPGTGGLYLASRLVGSARAHRLALSGSIFKATDDEVSGLVDIPVDPGISLARALSAAKEITGKPRGSVERIKSLINEGFIADFQVYLKQEEKLYIECFQTRDAQIGYRAFVNKEVPVWTHR